MRGGEGGGRRVFLKEIFENPNLFDIFFLIFFVIPNTGFLK
jgi:hypothetical protein